MLDKIKEFIHTDTKSNHTVMVICTSEDYKQLKKNFESFDDTYSFNVKAKLPTVDKVRSYLTAVIDGYRVFIYEDSNSKETDISWL